MGMSINGLSSSILGGVEKGLLNSNKDAAEQSIFTGIKEMASDALEQSGIKNLGDSGIARDLLSYRGRGWLKPRTATMSDDEIEAVASQLGEASKNAMNADGSHSDLSSAIGARMKALTEGATRGQYEVEPGFFDHAANIGGMVKDYYTNGSNRELATKAAATAGVYAAGAIGGRYLSGGTLTTNNQGESDIAGIPFI